MPSLNRAIILKAAADVDVETPHQWPDRRQVFLILRLHVRVLDNGATVGRGRRQRHVERFVNQRRNGPPAVAATGGSGFPPRPTRVDRRRAPRERRRLPEARAPRRVQLCPHSLVLPTQPIPFPLEPRPIGFHAIALLTNACQPVPQPVYDLVQGARRRVIHALVMPEFPRDYKSDPGNQ